MAFIFRIDLAATGYCPQTTIKTAETSYSTIRTTVKYDTSSGSESPPTIQNPSCILFFLKRNSYQNNIILAVVSLAILIFIVVVIFVIWKKRRERNEERDKEMSADVNPVYGIYDDRPMYNVVTDENAFYSS